MLASTLRSRARPYLGQRSLRADLRVVGSERLGTRVVQRAFRVAPELERAHAQRRVRMHADSPEATSRADCFATLLVGEGLCVEV